MYQQYRVKRNSSWAWAKSLAIIFVLTLLIWGTRYLSKLSDKVETIEPTISSHTWSTSITDWRYVWKKISLEGQITPSSNPLLYSHIITLSWGEAIETLSSHINLSESQGYIYAQWEVVKYDGKKFIVDITAIGSTPDQLSTVTLPVSKNSKTFPSIALKIDMTNHSDVSYTASWDKILFHVEGFSDTMSVQWFRCETWFPEKDCDQIQKWFSGGSFVNAEGMTFIQWSHNQRFARNSAGVWYLITSPSDSLVYKASSVLVPLNESYIKSLLPAMEKLCAIKSVWQPLMQKITVTSWQVHIKNSAGADCNVSIAFTDTGDEMSIGNKATSQATNTTTSNSKTNSWTKNTQATTVSTGVAPTLASSGWYTYVSARGWYHINFPSAKIAYNGTTIQDNLGVDKLNCYMRLDIKDYKDKDDDAIGAALSIYECTSKESSAILTSKTAGYIFKTSKDGSKLFFIKTLNPSWSSVANKISIQ